jgi:hypothetical protein
MRSTPIKAALLLSALLFSTAALAQDMGHDEVTLKNGGSIRGTVVSSEPGVSVKIIEMGQKEARTVPWAQVSDVERDKYKSKPENAQPGGAGPGYAHTTGGEPVAVPEPALGQTGVVRLHVDSPEPVQVQSRRMEQGSVNGYGFVITQLTPVCVSPCDKVIDGSRGQEFVASGDFPGAKAFNLSGMKGEVDLAVQPGNKGVRALGITMDILGATGMVLGGTLALTGGLTSSSGLDGTSSGMSGLTRTGLITLGTSTAVLIGGIIATVSSGSHFQLSNKEQTASIKPRYWLGQF